MDPSAYMHQYGSNSGPPNQGHLPQVFYSMANQKQVCRIDKNQVPKFVRLVFRVEIHQSLRSQFASWQSFSTVKDSGCSKSGRLKSRIVQIQTDKSLDFRQLLVSLNWNVWTLSYVSSGLMQFWSLIFGHVSEIRTSDNQSQLSCLKSGLVTSPDFKLSLCSYRRVLRLLRLVNRFTTLN